MERPGNLEENQSLEWFLTKLIECWVWQDRLNWKALGIVRKFRQEFQHRMEWSE